LGAIIIAKRAAPRPVFADSAGN